MYRTSPPPILYERSFLTILKPFTFTKSSEIELLRKDSHIPYTSTGGLLHSNKILSCSSLSELTDVTDLFTLWHAKRIPLLNIGKICELITLLFCKLQGISSVRAQFTTMWSSSNCLLHGDWIQGGDCSEFNTILFSVTCSWDCSELGLHDCLCREMSKDVWEQRACWNPEAIVEWRWQL